MIPQTNGKVSLRNVRTATSDSLNHINQHARLLNTQILPNINFLKRELDETKAKLAQMTARLDAFQCRDLRGRLRYLFLGR